MFEVGDSVWFYFAGWRTGVFLGVVEKSKKHFGLYRVKPNCLDRSEILVEPDFVEAIKATRRTA